MGGKIKRLVDQIIEKKAKGNEITIAFTRAKLILKGIDPSRYTDQSSDDQAVITKLERLAMELGVDVNVR